ncbi:MAG: TA system VapC family ribonuclease toxin [Verrucomicrobiales bacterium]|nr:PIN domain-containing protein [Verrucomicrobiota bacterium JB025]
MTSVDTNILLYSLNPGSERHGKARDFLQNTLADGQVVITDYVLVELYNLLRNPVVLKKPLTAKAAAGIVTSYLKHPTVTRAENAPVMEQIWEMASRPGFPRRRIFDLRLALTLQHHGVTHFATANVKDFKNLGFEKVWNPLT